MMMYLVLLLALAINTLADISTTEVYTSTVETTTLSDNENDSNSTAQTYRNNTKIRPKNQSLSVCTCNLQVSQILTVFTLVYHYFLHFKVDWCDINCCCDPDCTSSDKLIFDHCHVDQNRYVDDRYCNYMQLIYINNTPFEWEVNQNGFFCIISNNLPTTYLVQKDKVYMDLHSLICIQKCCEKFKLIYRNYIQSISKHNVDFV